MPSSNLRFQDYQFQQAALGGYWKWTTRVDLTGPSPVYSVRDIVSPYGILRDSIPIPSGVVEAMAESVSTLKTSFAPSILVAPLSLAYTLDEGRGYGVEQCLSVTNNGTFGSLLNASITTSASFVQATPAQLGNLSPMEMGQIEVNVTSTDLLAANSPYVQTVTVQDPTATNTPITVPVTITVLPKAVVGSSLTSLNFYVARPLTGPYPAIPAQSFSVQNNGALASRLSYIVQKLYGSSNWLSSFTPSTGTLVGGASQPVVVSVAPPESCLPGTYSEVLRVSGYSSNSSVDVKVTLVIS